MRALGAEAIFVGSGVFHSGDPAGTAKAIVQAAARHEDADVLVAASRLAGAPMRGIAREELPGDALLQARGA